MDFLPLAIQPPWCYFLDGNLLISRGWMMAFKTNRESADAAKIAADEATLPNVRDRELRSSNAYAALAVRDERIAGKAKDREAQEAAGGSAEDENDES